MPAAWPRAAKAFRLVGRPRCRHGKRRGKNVVTDTSGHYCRCKHLGECRNLQQVRHLSCFAGAPTVSAMCAPRTPIGFGEPVVVSRAVWCSVSALSSAPSRIAIPEDPRHESDRRTQRTVCLVELAETGGIPGEECGGAQPKYRGRGAARSISNVEPHDLARSGRCTRGPAPRPETWPASAPRTKRLAKLESQR